MLRLTGLGVSPGVAIGRALVLRQRTSDVRFRIAARDVDRELVRLAEARAEAATQLEEIKARVTRMAGPDHGYMFDAQRLMLDDAMLIERAAELIRGERFNAEWALQRAADEVATILDQIDDAYLRERKGDLQDVVGRLCRNLRGHSAGADLPQELDGPSILIADELSPSTAAQVDWTRVVGFATDAGSWTYHTAILARSLRVPAVTALGTASTQIPPGAIVALDGESGEVVVEPGADTLRSFERRARESRSRRVLPDPSNLPTTTRDGRTIAIEANIELVQDAADAKRVGADGIGLYRSEYLFAERSRGAVGEEVQYEAYAEILAQMAPRPVTIRTFDLTDEQLGWAGKPPQSRGRLGVHGIRLSLAEVDLFRTQLRALLRAARHGQLRVMFPFVTDIDELRRARALVDEVGRQLREEGLPPPSVPLGVTIEVPSAALTADLLAREADFLSIGTNDLIQYCLAVDRTDERVSHLYAPHHPAILRLIHLVQRAAHRQSRPLSICGEMASDPVMLTVLLGLGVNAFSMTPSAIRMARQVVRDIDLGEVRRLARRALTCATVVEVEQLVARYVERAWTRRPAVNE